MMTVSKLARSAGLSRSTVLYYESAGLLRPPKRSQGNYRVYGAADLDRLRQINLYRSAGLTLADIRIILNQPNTDFSAVLKQRLAVLSLEIERLREHQRAIARLLQKTDRLRRCPMVTKDKWVEVMRAAGFTEADMHRWHAQFEKLAPEEHDEFLKFLRIPEAEVQSIREWSRKS